MAGDRGGRLPLPTSSQDFNPIEQTFATSKQQLRRLATRSYDAAGEAIGEAPRTITPGDCAGWFRAPGCRA
ncbi:MAG: hypothetical protein ACR2J8_11455 [Thermomicrobiales bacterium]